MSLVEPDGLGGFLFTQDSVTQIRVMMGQLHIIAANTTP